jgi:hypothetical protein
MPRYFFSVRDGMDIPDVEGTELAGLHEARLAAVTAAGEAIRDLGQKFWSGEAWQMHVTDESGVTVCRLNFSAEA